MFFEHTFQTILRRNFFYSRIFCLHFFLYIFRTGPKVFTDLGLDVLLEVLRHVLLLLHLLHRLVVVRDPLDHLVQLQQHAGGAREVAPLHNKQIRKTLNYENIY